MKGAMLDIKQIVDTKMELYDQARANNDTEMMEEIKIHISGMRSALRVFGIGILPSYAVDSDHISNAIIKLLDSD